MTRKQASELLADFIFFEGPFTDEEIVRAMLFFDAMVDA